MSARYIGEDCVSLTNGKVYTILDIQGEYFKIIDDTEEDYYFLKDEFEIV